MGIGLCWMERMDEDDCEFKEETMEDEDSRAHEQVRWRGRIRMVI